MAEIVLDKVTKSYPDDAGGVRHAVKDLSLTIADGEFIILVGPSGCGKSTTLNMIAGLEDITSGEIRIDGERVNEVAPKDRDIAMVFQSYALYPHMTVRQNIAFPLTLAKMKKADIARKVEETAKILDLNELLDRKPAQLSGGQRQRVAMGRAIVRQPKAFLMDEPLSNLDAKLRVQMRAEIARLQDDLGVTTIYVTHDQIEAMTMGDRVAVMRRGRLQQVAPPQELYDRPVNMFVGGFIGSPAMNLLEATVERDDGGYAVVLGEHRLALPDELVSERPAIGDWVGRTVVLGIRPEALEDPATVPADVPEDRRLPVRVVLREALGSEVNVHAVVAAPPARTAELEELQSQEALPSLDGDTAEATIVGRLSPHATAAEGDRVELAVDTGALHFFDPDSGLGIYEATTEGARS